MNVFLGFCRAQHWFPMITVKYELINCGESASFLSFFFFARLAAPILSHRHWQMIAEICAEFHISQHKTNGRLMHSQVALLKDHLSGASGESKLSLCLSKQPCQQEGGEEMSALE